MPDFTFTSPDGKNYTVTGPEGATKEQAFQILQQQISSGTAKQDAAPAAPASAGQRAKETLQQRPDWLKPGAADKPSPTPTVAHALGEIATSAGLGGALGALSPEILTGLGAAASLIPEVGPEIGTALVAAGNAARGARLAAAATGALSGAVSETAGQGAEALGASKSVANTARLAAGFATPEVGLLASKAKGLYNAVTKAIGLERTPAAVQKAAATLRGLSDAGVPQNALHQTLQQGADAEIQAAQQAGDKVMQDARQRAAQVGADDSKAAQKILSDGQKQTQKLLDDARQRAQDLNKLSKGRMATAGKVLAQAEPALRVVGQPQELSDIGKELQGTVYKNYKAGLDARQSSYQTLKAQRDAVVQAKEAAGETLDKTPAMQELKSYIDSKTLKSVAGREAAKGMAPVTDQATLRTYENIREAINNRRVQVGIDEAGNPKYQTFKTSFEALDQVRRKLGDVVANRDVEGYSAIGKSLATQLYDRIGKVQRDFVGEQNGVNLQKQLQEQYSGASKDLQKFNVGAGGKATALDRVDPERFAADPQGLPRQFFSSQQSMRDLKELTQDPAMVERTARSYVAQQLRGQSAEQVKNYMQKNADWIREVPGLRGSITDYALRLQKIERTAAAAGKSAEGFGKQAEATTEGARRAAGAEQEASIKQAGKAAEGSLESQQRVLQQGEKQAEAARAKAAGPAEGLQKILGGGERPEAVKDLLLNGKPEQTRLAARIASQTPEGKRQLEDSVRQITARMGEKELTRTWNDRLKPMLEDGKMLPPERMKALTQDVERLLKSYRGKPPLTLVQRHIYAAIGGAAADYLPGLTNSNRGE
jgi:hypothetical protein